MKVFLHYEDNEDKSLHKSLKIKLPKSWKNGPTSKILTQFVESYNAAGQGLTHPLSESDLHLAQRVSTDDGSLEYSPLASDAITIDVIEDRDDVMIQHGASQTLAEMEAEQKAKDDLKKKELEGTAKCTRLGCNNRFPKGGPYPECSYHKSPPVFHETVKFWSCCPTKKAYDWDEFQAIPGCCTGTCTEVKEDENEKLFLGGCDLRGAAVEASPLKSIEDFNKGPEEGQTLAPVLDRLKDIMGEIDIENELFDQVLDGIKKEVGKSIKEESELEKAVTIELGQKLKKAMKSIAVEQLRIR
jgi:hypothetical protein